MEIELANSNHFILGLFVILIISSILIYCLIKSLHEHSFKRWRIHLKIGLVILSSLLIVSFAIIFRDSILFNLIRVNQNDVTLVSTWSERMIEEPNNIEGIEIRYFPRRPLYLLVRMEDETVIRSCGFTLRDYERTIEMLTSHFDLLLDEYGDYKKNITNEHTVQTEDMGNR